jgi:hypothetical protein
MTPEDSIYEVWCVNAYLPDVPAPFVGVERCGSISVGFLETPDPLLCGYYCEPCAAIVDAWLLEHPVTDEAGLSQPVIEETP